MAKQHGSLARAGKVKNQTPKVAPAERSNSPQGRARKRVQYNKRFLTGAPVDGRPRKCNPQPMMQQA